MSGAAKRVVTVAVVQMPCGQNSDENVDRAEKLVREAGSRGANMVLLQELFETQYFCQRQDASFLSLAKPLDGHPAISRMCSLAKELGIVLPISFFELAGCSRFNSCAVIDADGQILGVYRKSHIPDGPGYSEKFYFSPGDTGFRVWQTRFCKLGVGICWDQWFPESARSMALLGAEVICFPTAIGSEPQDPSLVSTEHWITAQRGHAAANLVPVIASNRVGKESFGTTSITFYGNSFIAGPTGELLARADDHSTTVLTASFDLSAIEVQRSSWGIFRDRRPELYAPILTLDGEHRHLGCH